MSLKVLSVQHKEPLLATRAHALNGIMRSYHELYSEMESSGAVPYRLTQLGAWAASRAPHVYYFFKAIKLCRYRLFVDLGSGDGIVACIAGLFTRSVGIEVDANLCLTARQITRQLGLDRRVHFICGDYRTQRIQAADCLYMYPDKPIYPVEALLSNWHGTLLIYGPHFPPSRLEAARHLKCGEERMTMYRPASDA